jgi:hypothetical protein
MLKIAKGFSLNYELIAKILCSQRWSVKDWGKQIMAASLGFWDVTFPKLFRKTGTA